MARRSDAGNWEKGKKKSDTIPLPAFLPACLPAYPVRRPAQPLWTDLRRGNATAWPAIAVPCERDTSVTPVHDRLRTPNYAIAYRCGASPMRCAYIQPTERHRGANVAL